MKKPTGQYHTQCRINIACMWVSRFEYYRYEMGTGDI